MAGAITPGRHLRRRAFSQRPDARTAAGELRTGEEVRVSSDSAAIRASCSRVGVANAVYDKLVRRQWSVRIVEVGDNDVGLKDAVIEKFLDRGVAAGRRDEQQHRNGFRVSAVKCRKKVFLPE